MKGKQVGYVLILVIVVGIVGLGARLVTTETEVPVLSGLRALTAENIDRVIIRDWENEVTLIRREDGTWWSDNNPVVQLKLEEFWDTAGRIEGAELVANNPDSHQEMGVSQEFATLVQFWKGGELQEEFLVGDKDFVGKSAETAFFLWDVYVRLCYLRQFDRDEVYSVHCSFPRQFDPRSRFWKDPMILQVPREDVGGITFAYPEGQFDLQVIDSVWMVGSGGERVRAGVTMTQDLLKRLEFLVARDFPTQEQQAELDFGQPDITLGVSTKPGSESPSALLLFLEGEDGGYWVKHAERPFVYFLNSRDVEQLLLTREALEIRR